VRCCTLSAARWSGLSVAGCFVREWVGFSHVAGRTALGGVSVVYRMAASERQRDGLSMPCRRGWRGELDDAQVHRNAMRALALRAARPRRIGVVGVARTVSLGLV
jgi:hypothetical protein